MTATEFVALLIKNILNPLLYLLFSAALIVFVYGIVEFLWGQAKGADDKEGKGKQHMLWGLVGLFIMLTAASIISLIVNAVFPGSWPPKAATSPSGNTPSIYQQPCNGTSC